MGTVKTVPVLLCIYYLWVALAQNRTQFCFAKGVFGGTTSANAKGAPFGARWDTRLWRDFFAAPLVSELPDGFGSKPNPILLRKRCIRGHRFRQCKRHTDWCAICIGGSGGIRTHGTVRYN